MGIFRWENPGDTPVVGCGVVHARQCGGGISWSPQERGFNPFRSDGWSMMTLLFSYLGGWFYLWCSSLFGEDAHFDEYFSNGLVQPPTRYHLPHVVLIFTALPDFLQPARPNHFKDFRMKEIQKMSTLHTFSDQKTPRGWGNHPKKFLEP